ncbi:MAG: hypothetical protein ACI835_003091, partial [Planctomycetota bacterium]
AGLLVIVGEYRSRYSLFDLHVSPKRRESLGSESSDGLPGSLELIHTGDEGQDLGSDWELSGQWLDIRFSIHFHPMRVTRQGAGIHHQAAESVLSCPPWRAQRP